MWQIGIVPPAAILCSFEETMPFKSEQFQIQTTKASIRSYPD
jgi:hypothetical protein